MCGIYFDHTRNFKETKKIHDKPDVKSTENLENTGFLRILVWHLNRSHKPKKKRTPFGALFFLLAWRESRHAMSGFETDERARWVRSQKRLRIVFGERSPPSKEHGERGLPCEGGRLCDGTGLCSHLLWVPQQGTFATAAGGGEREQKGVAAVEIL